MQKKTADADREVRFSISDELTAKIRTCRGKRIKIIARVPRKMHEEIKVLKVIKLNTRPSADCQHRDGLARRGAQHQGRSDGDRYF